MPNQLFQQIAVAPAEEGVKKLPMTEIKFSESDFKKLKITKCNKSSMNDLLKVINGETLGKKVSIAISLKRQGHFNRAMLNITEANRDQVIAIREIQCILDKLENRNKTEIVFENFRQSLPLQIGLSNGKDVLELLDRIENNFNGTLSEKTNELHKAEVELDIMHEELIFFQERIKGRISAKELDDSKEKLTQFARKVYRVKKLIADNLIEFVTEKYNTLAAEDRFSLISNIYRVITSSIETKDSIFVKL